MIVIFKKHSRFVFQIINNGIFQLYIKLHKQSEEGLVIMEDENLCNVYEAREDYNDDYDYEDDYDDDDEDDDYDDEEEWDDYNDGEWAEEDDY